MLLIEARTRRPLKLAVAAAAAGLALALSACGSPQSPSVDGPTEEIKLSLDWSTYVAYHAPIVLAQERGIFAKHGLKVADSLTGGSKDAVLATGTNQADIAWADLSTAASSMLSGLPIKAVATVQDKNASGLTVLEGTKLDSAKDAAGFRIGSTPGGSDSTLVGAFLKKNNIPESEVTIVNLPANGKFAALMTGKVDAISGQVYYYVSSAANEGKAAHGKSYSEMNTDTLDHGFVASNDFIAKHPGAIQKFLAAYQEALGITQKDPSAACKTLSERANGALTTKACEDQLKLWLPLAASVDTTNWGENNLTKWTSTVDILKSFGGATGTLETSQMFTNAFLPGSKK